MQSLNSRSVAADRALCCLSALHLALVGHCHLKNCLLMGQKKSDIKDKDFILMSPSSYPPIYQHALIRCIYLKPPLFLWLLEIGHGYWMSSLSSLFAVHSRSGLPPIVCRKRWLCWCGVCPAKAHFGMSSMGNRPGYGSQ